MDDEVVHLVVVVSGHVIQMGEALFFDVVGEEEAGGGGFLVWWGLLVVIVGLEDLYGLDVAQFLYLAVSLLNFGQEVGQFLLLEVEFLFFAYENDLLVQFHAFIVCIRPITILVPRLSTNRIKRRGISRAHRPQRHIFLLIGHQRANRLQTRVLITIDKRVVVALNRVDGSSVGFK